MVEFASHSVRTMDTVLINWPAEEATRQKLAQQKRRRLLLVAENEPAPVCDDILEDWVRLPCGAEDIQARLDGLLLRSQTKAFATPEIDDEGILRFGRQWASLTPVEHRLGIVLVDNIGAVTPRDVLTTAISPDGQASRNSLDVHMSRLRARLSPLGLTIRTVRSRGYMLQIESEPTT